MSRTKMFIAGAVAAVASLVASGPAFATATTFATTFLFDDGPTGTALTFAINGSVVFTTPPNPDIENIPVGFDIPIPGIFSFPTTTISILDPSTSLVSDNFQISSGTVFEGGTLTSLVFGSNDVSDLPFGPFHQPISPNTVFETGLVQTLFFAQDDSGDTLTVNFLSEGDAPRVTNNSVPEPSTLAMFGGALAALGMMMRRRVISPRS